MFRVVSISGLLLIASLTGCSNNAGVVARPVIAEEFTSGNRMGTPLTMGAGDSLGKSIFYTNTLASGPVIVETATIAGD